MSLTMLSTGKLVGKQLHYKIKAFIGVFGSLVLLQCIAIFFSLIGNDGTFGSSSFGIEVSVESHSASMVVAFTILWMFISAVLITTRAYRDDDFTFVTTRLTANLSNILFLGIASALGGATAILSGYFIKVFMYYGFRDGTAVGLGANLGLKELFIGLFATSLCIFLFSSVGYLIGMIVQINKLFIVLIPVLSIGLLTTIGIQTGVYPLIPLGEFYFQETSIWLFFIKVVITASLLFFAAIVISNKMEVRR